MTITFERPVSHAAHLSSRFGAFALVLCIAVLLGHRFGPLATPNLIPLLMVAAGLAALAVFLAFVGLRSLWNVGAEGGADATRAIIYAILPLALAGFAAERYFTLPAIYDVSSDVGDVPQWLDPPHADQIWLPPRTGPTKEDRDAQLAAYPELTGRRYDGAIDRVLQAVKKVAGMQRIAITKLEGAENAGPELEDMPAKPAPQGEDAPADAPPDIAPVPVPRPLGDEVGDLIRHSEGVLIQGSERTLILGLRFDILIRLREEEETTLVDVRVASRYGPHDLGMSAEVAESYLKALDAELLGIAGD